MNEIKEFDFEADVYMPIENQIPIVTQYDTSIILNFFLTSRRVPLDLTGSIVKARLMVPKTSRLVEQDIDIISAEDGVCRVLINDFSTSEVGTVQGLLDIFDVNGHKYSILKFGFVVNSYLGDINGGIENDANFPILNQLIENVCTLENNFENLIIENRREFNEIKEEIKNNFSEMESVMNQFALRYRVVE